MTPSGHTRSGLEVAALFLRCDPWLFALPLLSDPEDFNEEKKTKTTHIILFIIENKWIICALSE